MTIDAQREAIKAMMALASNVASKKINCVNLPQGLQHESTQVGEDKLLVEENEIWLSSPLRYIIIIIHSIINDDTRLCTMEKFKLPLLYHLF
jgi:hypothetical protein